MPARDARSGEWGERRGDACGRTVAREAGVPAPMLETLSVGAKALISYEWMQGRKYDPKTDTRTSGDLNVAGNNWAKIRESERLKRIGRSNPNRP